MSLVINKNYVKKFINPDLEKALDPIAKKALDTVISKSGAGNDFLGWVDLPENYDKEEFARIKVAAEKIKKSCDALVVIGIGGS